MTRSLYGMKGPWIVVVTAPHKQIFLFEVFTEALDYLNTHQDHECMIAVGVMNNHKREKPIEQGPMS